MPHPEVKKLAVFRHLQPKLKKAEREQILEETKTKRERALELLRAGGLADFWFFATRILRGDDGKPLRFSHPVHGDIAYVLQNHRDLGVREILILMARGHFKSTLLAAYMAWRIVGNRQVRTIGVSASEPNANKIGRRVSSFLQQPLVVALYGPFAGRQGLADGEFRVRGASSTFGDATFTASGRNNFRPGPHIEVLGLDDFEDEYTTSTPEMTAKGQDFDAKTIPPTDHPDSVRITVGTYKSDSDIHCYKEEKYAVVTEERLDDGRKVPVRRNGIIKNGCAYFYKPLYREDGEILFPEEFTAERIAKIRFDLRLKPTEFAREYLLDPVHRESAAFREEDFRIVNECPFAEAYAYVALDLANTVGQDSARTGIVEFSVGPHLQVHVTRARGEKLDGARQMEELFQLDMAYDRPSFVIEEENYVRGWKIGFEALQRERRRFLRIEYINAHGRKSKDERILGLQGILRAGNVTFSADCGDLIHELLRFPQARYRDVADAFATGIEVARSPREAARWKYLGKTLHVSEAARGLMEMYGRRADGTKETLDPKASLAW